MSRTFLVPHDFTPVGDVATKHAIFLASKTSGRVLIVHVIKNASEREEAEKDCGQVISANHSPGGPILDFKVVDGNIFEHIAMVADEEKADMIIMGTHGAKGMQKIFGSFAIKVINSTKIPFMIVQNELPSPKLDHIVVPITMTKESIQIISIAGQLAKLFGAMVHVVGADSADIGLAQKLKNRIALVRKEFAKNEVSSVFHLIPKNQAFKAGIMEYGDKVGVDVFALAYHTESILPQFDRFAQSIITNKTKTPVMIVQATDVTTGYF